MGIKDPVAVVERYIADTGCTLYIPEDFKERKFLDKAVSRGVLVKSGKGYTLPLVQKQEEEIAKFAVARLHYNEDARETYTNEYLDMFINLYQMQEGIKLDEWQRDAVYLAMNNNLFVLTGGPGTGKTCVLKCIEFCLRTILQTDDLLFTAPTGKAARRITESVGCDAFTVAKVLGLCNEQSVPKKISRKCMIVDEISMLDTYTAHALFTSLSLDSKLILVGDVEQLPSVGYGSVLRDLIDAGLPCTKLEKTFRQASESGLFANIEQVKAGLHMGFVERDDFKVFQSADTVEAKDIMVREFLDGIKAYGLEQVVCLTPFRRKGEACAIRLNEILQEIINPLEPGKAEISVDITEEDGFMYRCTFRTGDPVMQLVNAEKVANGDVGRITSVDVDKMKLTVKYIDCEISYTENELGQLALAYAMSVHKSQGSEYKCVITSAITEDFSMLSRNTIYTAITRAKQECRIVTNGDIAKEACKKESGYERVTGLAEKIILQNNLFKLMSGLAG